jgi:hypothetical protein
MICLLGTCIMLMNNPIEHLSPPVEGQGHSARDLQPNRSGPGPTSQPIAVVSHRLFIYLSRFFLLEGSINLH